MPNIAKDISQKSATFICQILLKIYSKWVLLLYAKYCKRYIPKECYFVIYLPYLFFRFHAKTLELYQAVCSHGNHRVANALTHHVDERLLMYCVQSESKYRYRNRLLKYFPHRVLGVFLNKKQCTDISFWIALLIEVAVPSQEDEGSCTVKPAHEPMGKIF
jgi:hypothetical protein